VIAAGKPFQSAAQLTPHMLATTSTPGQGGGHPGAGGAKVPGFPTGYLPVPTSANPGAGQTLVFGQLGVLGSPQPPPSLQQQQQQQSTNKQDQVQKVKIILKNLFILQYQTGIFCICLSLLKYYLHLYMIFYISNSIQHAPLEHLQVEELVVCSLHPGNSRLKYGPLDCNNRPCSLLRLIKYSFVVPHKLICLYRVHSQYRRIMVSIFIYFINTSKYFRNKTLISQFISFWSFLCNMNEMFMY